MSCVVTQDWTKVADEVFNTGLVRLSSKKLGQAASPSSCQGWAINHRGQTLWKRTKHFHLQNYWKDIFPSLFIYWYYLSFHLWWWQLVGGCESESVSRSVVSNSLQPQGLLPTKLLCPWNSPGKNTGVGSYSLFQGIFLTQGSNTGSPAPQTDYHLSHQGSPLTYYITSQTL